jgi:beta-glucosidase/6-phospho-beta-glucosidase/beta-galactosidase
MEFKFPKDFMFGAASSACQIESASRIGGKGEDVKDHYYLIHPDKFLGADPDKSADFYFKYAEDIKMMQELGLKIFRFSISWSRIFPNGPDYVNQAGIDYYYDMMLKLKEAGIILSVDVTAPDGGSNWSNCYDRNVIGDVADYIVFMAYDQYGINAKEPGTTAGFNWVETSLKKFID